MWSGEAGDGETVTGTKHGRRNEGRSMWSGEDGFGRDGDESCCHAAMKAAPCGAAK
jgi:hypothetical protein